MEEFTTLAVPKSGRVGVESGTGGVGRAGEAATVAAAAGKVRPQPLLHPLLPGPPCVARRSQLPAVRWVQPRRSRVAPPMTRYFNVFCGLLLFPQSQKVLSCASGREPNSDLQG